MSFRCKRFGLPQQVTYRLFPGGTGTYNVAYLPAITVCQYKIYSPPTVNVVMSKIRIRLGGVAAVSLIKVTYTPTGSGLVGGDAQEAIVPVHSGGAILAGASTIQATIQPTPSGGAVGASSARITLNDVFVPTGGALGAGAATESFVDN